VDWETTSLSSKLRQFRMQACYVARVVVVEPSLKDLEELFKQMRSVYQRKLYPSMEFDKLRYGPSLLLYEVT